MYEYILEIQRWGDSFGSFICEYYKVNYLSHLSSDVSKTAS